MSSGAIDTMDPNRWYFAVTWGLANAMCTTLVRYADQPGAAGTSLVPGTAGMPGGQQQRADVHVHDAQRG